MYYPGHPFNPQMGTPPAQVQQQPPANAEQQQPQPQQVCDQSKKRIIGNAVKRNFKE